MNKQEHTGLSLMLPPRETPRSLSAGLTEILLFLPVFAGFACLLETFLHLSAFGGLWAFALGGVPALVLYFLLRRRREPVLPPILVLGAALAAETAFGLPRVWNTAREGWMTAFGVIVPALREGRSPGLHAALLILLLGALLGMFSLLLLEKAPRALALLLLIPALFGGYFFDAQGILLLLPLAAALLTAAAAHPGEGEKPMKMRLLSALCCALCAAIVLGLCPRSADASLAGLRESTRDILHGLRWGTCAALPGGDLTRPLPEEDGGTLLTVTADAPQDLWLRGFVGDTYENGRWRARSNGDAAAEADLLYWLQRDAFYPQNQFAAAFSLLPEVPAPNRVSVTRVSAGGAFAFAPFDLAEVLSGGALPEGKLALGVLPGTGEKTVTFTTVGAEKRLPELLELLQSRDPAARSYLQAESAWREFAVGGEAEAPELPESMEETLTALCAPYGGRDQLTPLQAQQLALEFSRKSAAKADPGNVDEALRGSGWQSVTSAVLALRWFGIPARYAEGFYIPAERLSAGTVLEVDETFARAWPEVYQDGLGWMPMAETPGFEQMSENPEESGSDPFGGGSWIGDDLSDVPVGQELEEDEREPEPDDPEGTAPEGQAHTRVRTYLLWTLGLLLALLLLAALALVLRRRLALNRREALFASDDLPDAVACLFSDSASLLSVLGVPMGEGSTFDHREELEERFGADFAGAYGESAELNREALFSSHPLTEEQRETLRRFRASAAQLVRSTLPAGKRLYWKWIRCLY